MNEIVLSFGKVVVGTSAERSAKIKNTSEKAQDYGIDYFYVTNVLDKVFSVDPPERSEIDPGKSYKITVKFKPVIANQDYINYYLIEDGDRHTYTLTVEGSSIGPKIKCKDRHIIFSIETEQSDGRSKFIEMFNESDVDTTFQWFISRRGFGQFQISSPHHGEIKARQKTIASLQFKCTFPGTYTAQLICLIHNHPPLCFTIFGKYSHVAGFIDELVMYKIRSFESEYDILFGDAVILTKTIPPITLSENYHDFGSGDVNDTNSIISKTICVTNHYAEEAYFSWLYDEDDVFFIQPKASKIEPQSCIGFRVKFRPTRENMAYGSIIHGSCRKCNDDPSHEYWTTLSLIGNSWKASSGGWLPKYTFQKRITLPPTVPYYPVYSTFILKNVGEFPLLFKLLSPVESNYVVLPMCGIIEAMACQIVHVSLQPKEPGFYIESWELCLNHSIREWVYFEGSAEISKLVVATKGVESVEHAMLLFPPTAPNCASNLVTYLHNVTRNYIHVRSLCYVSWIGADNGGTFFLRPNEVVPLRWWFYPDKPKEKFSSTIVCSSIALLNNQKPVGEPNEIFLNVVASSAYPKIKVSPTTVNLFDIIVDQSVEFNFTISNVGICEVHFSLECEVVALNRVMGSEEIIIQPNWGTLSVGSRAVILGIVHVSGVRDCEGLRRMQVYMRLRRHAASKVEFTGVTDSKRIFNLYYYPTYPHIEVERVQSIRCMAIFSEHCLWKLMNINGLNKALRDVQINEILEVEIPLPEGSRASKPMEFNLILRCKNQFQAVWNIGRQQMCDCKRVEKMKGSISFPKKLFECPHRNLVIIEPRNGILPPYTLCTLNVKVKYELDSENILAFVLHLNHSRKVVMKFRLFCHPLGNGIMSSYNKTIITEDDKYHLTLDFGYIPVDYKDPITEVIWLYNGCNCVATWRLRGVIGGLRRGSPGRRSLVCDTKAVAAPPGRAVAIRFRFLPRQFMDYEAVFYGCFGPKDVIITVKGNGCCSSNSLILLDTPHFMQMDTKLINSNLKKVYLSTEHLNFLQCAPYTTYTKMFAIINDSDDLMRFSWIPERVQSVAVFKVCPSWGVIQPRSTYHLIMTGYIIEKTAIVTFRLGCELMNLTLRRKFERYAVLIQSRRRRCMQEFIIDEKGLRYPDENELLPTIQVVPKPESFNLSMSVCLSAQSAREYYLRMTLNNQLSKQPFNEFLFERYNYHPNFVGGSGDDENLLTQIQMKTLFESLLWPIVTSQFFHYQIETLEKIDLPLYSQIKKGEPKGDRKKIPRRVLAGICNTVIQSALHSTLDLHPAKSMKLI